MRISKNTLRLSLLTLCTAFNHVFAAGFMLQEQNAAQTGDFGAGGAAIAEDASTAWFNPAGLVRLDHPQIVLGGNEVVFETAFTGNATYYNSESMGLYNLPPSTQYAQNVTGGTSNFIPFFHVAYPINNYAVAGFSVTTPFGLATNYGDTTFTRYAATDTKLKTFDLSPSIGLAINKQFSFGFGFDLQRLLATFDNYAGFIPDNTQYNLNPNDTLSHNVASDWAEGWHTGILYQPTQTTRFGLAYHSKMVHHASGYSLFSGDLASPDAFDINPHSYYYSGDAETTVYFPASTMLSAYHDINNRWALMGSIVFTEWNSFKTLTLKNVIDSASPDGYTFIPQNISVTVPQNFHDTWRTSIGTNYRVDSQWLIRTGIGYDQSPVNNVDRNLRLPDGGRYAIAFGGRYIATKAITLDAGWTHEFIRPVSLGNTTVQDVQSLNVNGSSKSHADVFGLQMTWNFV